MSDVYYLTVKVYHSTTYERSRWNMGHIGTKDNGVQWDNWGTLGQVSLCAPQCPNVPQCLVLQYSCDRLSPPKTAILNYIGEITVKSIEICTLYLLRLFHRTLLSTHVGLPTI